jgi:lysozyme
MVKPANEPLCEINPPEQRAGEPSGKQKAAAAIAAAVLVATPLTASFEGLRTHPYRDVTGTPTVCYGDTEVEMRVYAADECGKLLRERVARDYAPRVLACLPQLLDERRKLVFAALIDASYNAGWAAVCKSRMAERIRAGQWQAACNGLSGWYVTSKGVPLRGLVRRREAEKALCLQGAA